MSEAQPETVAGRRAVKRYSGWQGLKAITTDVLEIEAEARAAGAARYEAALRTMTDMTDALEEEYGPRFQAVVDARAALAAAPLAEQGDGLDVERLAEAMQGVEHASAIHFGGRRAEWDQVDGPWRKAALDEATKIAAEYARLTPSRPAEES